MATNFDSTSDFLIWARRAGLEPDAADMLPSIVRGTDPDFLENSFKVHPIQHDRPVVHLLRVCVGPIDHYKNRFYDNGDVVVILPSKTEADNLLARQAAANSKGQDVLFMVALYNTSQIGEVPVLWTCPYTIDELSQKNGVWELLIHPLFANREE